MTLSSETKHLLQQHYNLPADAVPEERAKSRWTHVNRFGFLQGIVAHGAHKHIAQLHSLLSSGRFAVYEQEFVDSMVDIYIRPFHEEFDLYRDATLGNIHIDSSGEDVDPETNGIAYKNFRREIEERDPVCSICWVGDRFYKIAHIIRQDNVSCSLLTRVGLHGKHLVQNGLRFCLNCHAEFARLSQYFEVINDKVVIRFFYGSEGDSSEKREMWTEHLCFLEHIRQLRAARDCVKLHGRQGVEADGGMALYFARNSDPATHPNREALKLHRTACLIWKMAGGTDKEEEDNDQISGVATIRVDDMIWINPIL